MEATAIVKTVRITPRKVRLVVDLVRGRKVSDALAILANTNKSSTSVVTKLINSAVANAVNNNSMVKDDLYIKTIYADDGVRMKRFMPRAKGSASSIIKRSSHITIVVADE